MKTTLLLPMVILTLMVLGFQKLSPSAPPSFQVPEGFVVEQIADENEVGSVVAITFDNLGKMVIAKEFGDIVRMIPKADGTYEQQIISGQLSNSQGIVFDGPDLLATAVGPQGVGLYRVITENGTSRVELVESVNRRIEDHGPHAPIWGPDGFLYWINANTAGIYGDPAPLSPVRKYHEGTLLERGGGFGGGFYRTPEGKVYRNEIARHNGTAAYRPSSANYADWELYSMGHRNTYDFSFNLIGELFAYDSDHEPDLQMPWYRGTRTNHILPGGEYGYREGASVHPDYYFDDAPLLEDLGRGSPTGVTTYLSYNYPKAYWDLPLFADWSRGRVIMSKLTRKGAGYTPESSNFIYGTPLNVTDVEVGPDGNVYFTLGGRDSEGGIYRVVYNGPDAMQQPQADTPIDEVLTMIQPRSAFSRQKASDVKAALGDGAWQQGLTAVVQNAEADPERRIRAMELLRVFGPGLDENTLRPLASDPSWQVRATVAYDLGLITSDSTRHILAGMLKDNDAFVQRRAAEGLMRTGLNPTAKAPVSPTEDIFPLLASEDASLRFAGRILLRTVNPNLWREAAFQLTEFPLVTEALLAYVQTVGDHQDMYNYGRLMNRQLELLKANPTDDHLLDLVRLIQYAMTKDKGVRNFPAVESASRVSGGVIYQPGRGFFISEDFRSGESDPGGANRNNPEGNVYEQMGRILLDCFPSSDWRLNREITRVLAYLQAPGALDEILVELKRESDQKQKIHYIDMVSRFEEGWDEQAIEQVSAWFVEASKTGGRRGAVTSMRTDFLSHIPADQAERVMARVQEVQPQGGGGFGWNRTGPGGALSEEDVESLIFNPESTFGEPAAGVIAYQKAVCAACHTFGPMGVAYGPDLTTVGQRFTREDLVRAIVYPSELIADQYQGVTITKTNGSAISGSILQEDNQGVILQIPGAGEISIPASEIASKTVAETSMMPEGLLDVLSRQERKDLLLLLLGGPSAIPDSTLQRMNNQ